MRKVYSGSTAANNNGENAPFSHEGNGVPTLLTDGFWGPSANAEGSTTELGEACLWLSISISMPLFARPRAVTSVSTYLHEASDCKALLVPLLTATSVQTALYQNIPCHDFMMAERLLEDSARTHHFAGVRKQPGTVDTRHTTSATIQDGVLPPKRPMTICEDLACRYPSPQRGLVADAAMLVSC